MKVYEAMEILWLTSKGHHEQVCGVSFYGYCSDVHLNPALSDIEKRWNNLGGLVKSRVASLAVSNVLICDAMITKFPQDNVWPDIVEFTLRNIISGDSAVSWCGNEFCSWNPMILDPSRSGEGTVYAGYAPAVGFVCNSPRLSDWYECLSDDQLALLHDSYEGKC